MLDKQWKPLGLDSWRRNGGYPEALAEVESQLDNFEIIGKTHCKEMGAIALRSNLAHQAERNGNKHTLIPEDHPLYESARDGTIMPSDMIRLIHEHPDLHSAELARLTHVGDKATNEAIDDPVRSDLLFADDLETESSNEASYYTINALSSEHPNEIGVSRKRVVYNHFGGEVLTIITNNLLLDFSDKVAFGRSFRKDMHDYARDIREKIRDKSDSSENPKPSEFSKHHDFLRDNLEPYLRSPDFNDTSSGLIELSTIYYGTLQSERTRVAQREKDADN